MSSIFGNDRFVGKMLRGVLNIVPHGWPVPILSGPLRGSRWITGHGTHGYWLGTYESDKQRDFCRLAPRGGCVFDVGANIGYYTLLAARHVGPTGQVFAWEPFPENVKLCERHLSLNRIGNVRLTAAAVAERHGEARFAIGASNEMGAISESGELVVRTIGLDAARAAGDCPRPDLMKIDVEGAEGQVLRGAAGILAEDRPAILLAAHGTGRLLECQALLEAARYDCRVQQYEPGMYDVVATPRV